MGGWRWATRRCAPRTERSRGTSGRCDSADWRNGCGGGTCQALEDRRLCERRAIKRTPVSDWRGTRVGPSASSRLLELAARLRAWRVAAATIWHGAQRTAAKRSVSAVQRRARAAGQFVERDRPCRAAGRGIKDRVRGHGKGRLGARQFPRPSNPIISASMAFERKSSLPWSFPQPILWIKQSVLAELVTSTIAS